MRMCLRSGYCCKQAPCPYGKWDESKHQCVYLEGDRPGEYRCGIHSQIVQDPRSRISPAFGAGCSSSLNEDRQNLERDNHAGPKN